MQIKLPDICEMSVYDGGIKKNAFIISDMCKCLFIQNAEFLSLLQQRIFWDQKCFALIIPAENYSVNQFFMMFKILSVLFTLWVLIRLVI